jgi:oligosaccharide repeat unit polymerase
LIREFGSIISAVLQAGKIYRQGVEGEIKGVIPYIFIFSYVGVFFSGLYTAFKNKITLIALLPLLAVILKQIAFVSRAGMLFGFLEFTISFFLFRHLLNKDKKHQKKTSKTKIVFSILLVFVLVYGSASLVKVLRNPVEDYKAASRSIGKFEGGAFISPSIYLYACSHLGVLNQYFINDDEKSSFGRNTFLPVYNILAKFDVVEDQGIYQQGYFIPMWTNTGTYLRELHSDFGYLGLFLIPFILGLISTWLWYKLYETQELIYLLLATFVYLIISFSFLVMITRVSFWLISFLLLIFPFVEKYQKQKFSNFTDP